MAESLALMMSSRVTGNNHSRFSSPDAHMLPVVVERLLLLKVVRTTLGEAFFFFNVYFFPFFFPSSFLTSQL